MKKVMPAGQVQKIRKGAKSCTECRRRKIRCIRSFEHAEICRRCEEQGSKCIAQTYTSGSTGRQEFSSKQRIAQLENKVFSLTETLTQMQEKANVRTTHEEALNVDETWARNISDGDFSASEQSTGEQPFHLRLLFQNDWLSVEGSSTSQAILGQGKTETVRLLSIARNSLQKLIPPKDEVCIYTAAASEWLTMLHSFFPLPSGAKCGEEIIASYEEMHCPNIDTIRLASWLLNVALIAEQLSPKYTSMEGRLSGRERRKSLSRAISATVEKYILIHDILVGSIHGLSISMQCIRLEIGRGNFHRAWVKLRHAIAMAELMGLPDMVQTVQVQMATHPVDDWQISKVQLWDLICATDRLLGMILNLSPITGCHQGTTANVVSVNGIVQNQVYLCRLTDIANKVQDLDRFSILNGPGMDACAFALDLSRELKTLASQTPETWWLGGVYDRNNVYLDHIVQFLHYYVAMRIHLPLTLRQCPDGENYFNRLACIDACESMLQKYQFLGRKLPPGLFLSEILDLQAFSAAVTLLLMSHMSSVSFSDVGVDKVKASNEVGQVIKLLQEKSNCKLGCGIAYSGFTTLCSLNDLLQEKEIGFDLRKSAFHAPLLGSVQVRRNDHFSQVESSWPMQMLSAFGLHNATIPFSDQIFDANTSVEPCLQDDNAQWDSIRSSTEDMFCGGL